MTAPQQPPTAAELRDEARREAVDAVLADYLDQVDPEEVDTMDLADNIVIALDALDRKGD